MHTLSVTTVLLKGMQVFKRGGKTSWFQKLRYLPKSAQSLFHIYLGSFQVYFEQKFLVSRYKTKDLIRRLFNFSFNHRPFANADMQAASHWNNRPDKLPWLQDPATHFKLQCRQPVEQADQRLHPTEAQVATLPHYTDPLLQLGRSENQVSFSDPYNAKDFYFEEPNKLKKPIVQHLERSFINWFNVFVKFFDSASELWMYNNEWKKVISFFSFFTLQPFSRKFP